MIKGLLLSILLTLGMPLASKTSEVVLENGTYTSSYTVKAENGIATNMIKKYFDKEALIEVSDDHYYLSITQLNSNLKNLTLHIGEESVGNFIRKSEGENKTLTFTLSKENLLKELDFSVYVSKMESIELFSILLDKTSFNKQKDTIDDLGERPGEFIPKLTVNGANAYNASLNEPFALPSASSSFKNNELSVTKKVYLGEEVIPVTNNSFTPAKEGIYKIIYRSSTPLYKTSLDNDSYSEFIINVDVKKDYSKLITSTIVPDGAVLQGGVITSGTIYQEIHDLMLKESINYKIYNIEFIKDGSSIKPDTNVIYNIVLEDSLKDKDLEVYYYTNGKLNKLNANNTGSIIAFETSNTGVFLVMEPGLPFNMPIWGYILLTVGLISLIIVVIVLVIIKKKNK